MYVKLARKEKIYTVGWKRKDEMLEDDGAWFAGSSGAIDDDQKNDSNQVVGCVPVAVAVAKLVAQQQQQQQQQ